MSSCLPTNYDLVKVPKIHGSKTDSNPPENLRYDDLILEQRTHLHVYTPASSSVKKSLTVLGPSDVEFYVNSYTVVFITAITL